MPDQPRIEHGTDAGDRTFRCESGMRVSKTEVADWHFRAGALDRLLPPWQDVRVIEDSGPLRAGVETVLSVPIAPFVRKRWRARIEEAVPGERFIDVQVSGPFGAWHHRHEFFETEGDASSSRLRDSIAYRMPMGPLGGLGAGLVRRDLAKMFRYRHYRTAADLQRHADAGDLAPQTVVITGGSGLIGTQLTAFLRTGGHVVRHLVRRTPDAGAGEYRWDPARGEIDAAAFDGADAVVHLAGAGIADRRWTPERMKLIRDSRVDGTRLIAETLAAMTTPPSVFVSTSAVGFYGNRSERVDESSAAGEGFLPEVSVAWEDAADAARKAGIRVVHPRIGVVLTPKGGALQKMIPPFKLGAGGPLGSGRQGLSWIGMDDLLGVLHRLVIDDRYEGPVNATAPEPVDQRTFAKALGRVLRRPAIAPMPGFAAKILFGRMAGPLLLEGVEATPTVLTDHGFRFETPDLESCLRLLLEGTPPGG
ncbi:MAG: TIGR01777 family protein [Phycisphaeraceae bacterium]|nr:TIGR01777 family protein [Phycisphaeraceae bacterium]